MKRLAALPLLLLMAMPAQAAVEVGADVGGFVQLGDGPVRPRGLLGITFAWRFSSAHSLGLGLRTSLPLGELPAPRLQYAFDFGLGALNATLPVSLGLSPALHCAGDSCRPAAEARAGFGLQAFDDFRAPWLTLEVAAPLGVAMDRQTLMLGLHVSMRWEPLEEDFE